MVRNHRHDPMNRSVPPETSHYGTSPGGEPLDQLLVKVQKPARYIGAELNAVARDLAKVRLRIALAFPDVYEVGMSHLGLKILYSVLNSRADLYAERVFAPWPDMEEMLRRENRPLATLETGTPLSRLDFVGFSLQYELCATSVLQMLELGCVPLRADQRGQNDPLVVAGGPGTFNPVPLSPFFDAMVIGDGEDVILEMADLHIAWKEAGSPRAELLAEWKKLRGVFVPTLHTPGEVVRRRLAPDLNHAHFPSSLVLPFCEIVHDRVGLEIARGCTRGCRFCQAGMIYRPVREREPQAIYEMAQAGIEGTGWEEVALLSLSSGDYSHIGELVRRMVHRFGPDKVALSLPSLRPETFDAGMAEEIRKVRKTGFTLAPEAGTDRLRRVINKGNCEEDLERAVTAAFKAGWQSVKLYFMIGLPFESDEDLDGLIGLVHRASKWARGGRITASVSTFVPKSHTPFQWAAQISLEETTRRQDYIRRFFRKGNIRVKFHDVRVSFLEGILARGDRHLSNVIETAFRNGARLDGWDDQLKFDVWSEAIQDAGIDTAMYLGPRTIEERLPWELVDSGVSREFLIGEWEKARGEELTEDCRGGACARCGVCDFQEVYPRLAGTGEPFLAEPEETRVELSTLSISRYRVRYAKLGRMKFLGHQDLIRVWIRALRRAGLRPDYSKGFHPHPKLRFSPPLALGIESLAEYVDLDLIDNSLRPESLLIALIKVLPDGIKPLEIQEIPLNNPPVSAKIQEVTYEITFAGSLAPQEVVEKVQKFEEAPFFEITGKRKGKPWKRDLKEWVDTLEVAGSLLKMRLKSGPSGSVHPLEAAGALLGVSTDRMRTMKVVKTSAGFEA